MNQKKWTEIAFVGVGLIGFLIFSQLLAFVWDFFRWPMFEDWALSLPQLLAVVCALLVLLVLKKIEKSKVFSEEVVVELSKVTYPMRKETLMSAVIVSVMVGIASIIVISFDVAWGSLTQRLFGF